MCEIFGVSSKTRVEINEYLKVFFPIVINIRMDEY